MRADETEDWGFKVEVWDVFGTAGVMAGRWAGLLIGTVFDTPWGVAVILWGIADESCEFPGNIFN